MFNPQKCDRITTISISLSMVKSLQPGVRLAPACPCRCSARRDWDGTAGLSGNLPIVKNGLGGKEKNIFTHHMCFEKILSLISTDALTRYSVVLIQLIWYIYNYIIYIICICMYDYVCICKSKEGWLSWGGSKKSKVNEPPRYWATDAALREKWMFPILITLCERVTCNGGSARTKTQHSNCFQVVWNECLTELLATIFKCSPFQVLCKTTS